MHCEGSRLPACTVEAGHLRPGIPVLRARGRLDRATVGELRLAVEQCLNASPWAIVVDLTALSELRLSAVPTLVDLAGRAGCADIGFYLVTAGGAVDRVLGGAPAGNLFDIHHSVRSAERALGVRS